MKPFKIDLSEKTAVITGAGSGIGRAIAIEFAKAGASVGVMDINEEQGQKVVDEIKEFSGSAVFYYCDVSSQLSVKTSIIKFVEQTGSLDIIINNAGISHIGNIEQTPEEDFLRIFNVNVKGVYNGMHEAIPFMKKQGSGVILNMGSVAAVLGLPDRFAYSMSKGAVENMTYTVARDYLEHNIRCNSIAPGRVHTPFVDAYLSKNYPGQEKEMYDKLAATQPIGRMGTPEEIAQLALYLCSDAASFITGTNVPIDGGFVKLNT